MEQMASVAVCLYSKYSQRCKEFLDDLPDNMGVQMLCIDNKQVRKAVMQDANGYHIKTVPCIFLFYSNGRLEKFEGSDAFVWLREQVQKKEVPPPPRPKSTPARKQAAARQSAVSVSADIVEIGKDEDDEDVVDDRSQEEEDIFFPDGSNQTQPQQQQPTEDMIENEISMRRASDQIITRKQDNIKELAQAMQRQREVEEERMNPPPPGAPNSSTPSSSSPSGMTRI